MAGINAAASRYEPRDARIRLRINSPRTHGSASSAEAGAGVRLAKDELPRPANDEFPIMALLPPNQSGAKKAPREGPCIQSQTAHSTAACHVLDLNCPHSCL